MGSTRMACYAFECPADRPVEFAGGRELAYRCLPRLGYILERRSLTGPADPARGGWLDRDSISAIPFALRIRSAPRCHPAGLV